MAGSGSYAFSINSGPLLSSLAHPQSNSPALMRWDHKALPAGGAKTILKSKATEKQQDTLTGDSRAWGRYFCKKQWFNTRLCCFPNESSFLHTIDFASSTYVVDMELSQFDCLRFPVCEP